MVAPSVIRHLASRCLDPGSDAGSMSPRFTRISLTTGFGTAVAGFGVVTDGEGGLVGAGKDVFGIMCGLPCNRCTSIASAAIGFFVTGSF